MTQDVGLKAVELQLAEAGISELFTSVAVAVYVTGLPLPDTADHETFRDPSAELLKPA